VRLRFEELGVPTIDADTLARNAIAPGSAGFDAVVERFGKGILGSDGAIHRRTLAHLVFSEAEARRALETIIHPIVRQAIDEWFLSLKRDQYPFALADIPLLFETGRNRDFDAVVVAACDPDTQRRRLLKRGMTDEEAQQRIAAQLSIADKIERADYVVRTDGPMAETDRQVAETLDALLTRFTP
jgi:dephospho-CoA kinase